MLKVICLKFQFPLECLPNENIFSSLNYNRLESILAYLAVFWKQFLFAITQPQSPTL